MSPKHPRISAPRHLAFVRSLPCAVCDGQPSQAAHLRAGGDGGMALKPSDCRVVPLCARCHGEQHAMPETEFWSRSGIDPERLAAELWAASGDGEAAGEIIRLARW